jgi:alkylated DNA repair dioxygenase AlkB
MSIDAREIPGLQYIADYISGEEQSTLLEVIDKQTWLTILSRRVQHYGYRYDYKSRRVDPSMYLGALPDWAIPLAERLKKDGLTAETPDQLIVNEYYPGQGIAQHIDCIPCFGDIIFSLSLASSCLMVFSDIKTGTTASILLEPGGLLVMSGEARNQWKHGIPPRKKDFINGKNIERERRISLTFRKVIKLA